VTIVKTKILAALFSTGLIAFSALVVMDTHLTDAKIEAFLENQQHNQTLSELGKYQKEERRRLCKGMYHIVTYTAKGTRSEARHGYVEIEGYMVPDIFVCLSYRDEAVVFLTRSNLWGDDGYWPSLEVVLPEKRGAPLTVKEKIKGWRISQDVPSNLPGDWVFVKWKNGSACVSAKKLKNFAETMDLPTITREGTERPLRKLPRE